MSLGRDAAGKTGTTNDSASVWFVGFTPDLAAAVATYDPRGANGYPMKNLTIGGKYFDQVFGSSLPGPIWKEAMTAALVDTPPTPFDLLTIDGLGTYVPPDPDASPSPSDSASGTASPTGKPAASPGPTAKPSPNPSPKPKPKPSTTPTPVASPGP